MKETTFRIASNIREEMRRKGVSQLKLSELTGLESGSIGRALNNLEVGKGANITTLYKIAVALDVKLSIFFKGV